MKFIIRHHQHARGKFVQLNVLGVRKKENVEKMELNSNCHKTLVWVIVLFVATSNYCLSFRAYIVKDIVDFAQLYCTSPEFLHIFKIVDKVFNILMFLYLIF